MKDPAKLEFLAGQFITLLLGQDAAGQPLKRSYSLASAPAQGDTIRIILRLVEGGSASALFEHMVPGAEVDLTGPHGLFVLDLHHPGDVVFAATGTGIAPVLPMLSELAPRQETGRRLVYWGVREEADLFARDEIEAACQQAHAELAIHLSAPGPDWTGAVGRITPAVLAKAPALAIPTFYLVGNGAMVKEVKVGLIARGIDRRKQIRTEAFF